MFFSGERRRLKPTAVPKQLFGTADHQQDSIRRSDRAKRRTKRISTFARKEHVPEQVVKQEPDQDIADNPIGAEITIDQQISTPPYHHTSALSPKEFSSTSTQCSIGDITPDNIFSIHRFSKQPSIIKYYTGFEDYEHFIIFFNILGPATSHLGISHIPTSPQDQLFIVLIKLRQAKDDFELSILFDIRPQAVSMVFNTWINFLYFQLEELNIWPSQHTTKTHMPTHFAELFPRTRVILDATEVPIQKPHACGPQRETFSSYKNRNTMKVMVGCTPRGTVSYVSSAYGGTTSDRQIIERSTLCSDTSLFEPGDSIMADRGIMVQDLFAHKNVQVNTPTMLKGKSQLEPEEIHRDRKVASKRIHIERVIGLAKTYKILKKEIRSNLVTLGNRIIHVCFHLCNFRRCIVGSNS